MVSVLTLGPEVPGPRRQHVPGILYFADHDGHQGHCGTLSFTPTCTSSTSRTTTAFKVTVAIFDGQRVMGMFFFSLKVQEVWCLVPWFSRNRLTARATLRKINNATVSLSVK